MVLSIVTATIFCTLFNCSIGMFGYLTFAHDQGQLCTHKNILMASGYQQSKLIDVAKFIIAISVITNIPICLLPCKNTIEELLYKKKGMSKMQNIFWTLFLSLVSCFFAILMPDVGSAMTLIGATFVPLISYMSPLIIFMKQINSRPIIDKEKITCIITIIIMLFLTITMSISVIKDMYRNKDESDPLTC